MANQPLHIEVTGLKEAIAATQKIMDVTPQALARAATRELETVMTRAKEMTPVDTGTLRASGYVASPNISGDNVEIQFGFGGAASSYAIYVHENLFAFHHVGQAKFLEQPLTEAISSGMGNRIAGHIMREAGLV